MSQLDSANTLALQQVVSAIILVLPEKERERVKRIVKHLSEINYLDNIDKESIPSEKLNEYIDEMNSTYAHILEMVANLELAQKG
ncbi:hypothetical protein ACX5HI_001185 [Proteus mirabilis]|uniref:hypothetical protein n=1 Tax=Proteus mirabilis TaxID=584 RepID=UPI001071B896|nr:hypothetical protein [Proteus mirabilis]EMC9361678.1 hypothetical protein [Proteus mirabilis]EMD6182729.1 hypothetical protein [Proteus mirabilis]MBS3881557.1 hypothetical protein [Proteus mirabilis]MBU3052286.1 hypothetical protein [Proteus mirabilis]MDF7321415.1 hypothetical protein [Proteus mirabilis]